MAQCESGNSQTTQCRIQQGDIKNGLLCAQQNTFRASFLSAPTSITVYVHAERHEPVSYSSYVYTHLAN